ncbi:MAG TPA: adenylate/guanylate cyclase domain-containing protein [Solirubrobacterales bacterium]
MECASCGHENASDARFCGNCGRPLSATVECPECRAANPAGQRFCNACGAELSPTAEPTDAESPQRTATPPDHLAHKIRAGAGAIEGERKQVTVLFADVMGSMDLAERCDPEEWREIMDRFFGILCSGVHLFEGTVDKFTGDGIMALFGAPVAHEDHAQRACFAALRLIDDLGDFTAELRRTRGLNFLVRIGINSGEVIVGGIGADLGMEYTAVGHTVGLAQRMEQLAEPGKAYLTEHTGALVKGYLALDDLGMFEVKGSSRPLGVHELTGVGAARGRLDISRARGFSRFVGRDEEMEVLENAFEQARGGEAQVIGIVGEAGVGKSRLCHEFTQRWRAEGVPVYHTSGLAHTRSVPLMPVMHLMRSYFDITDQDSDRRARERIAGKLLLLDEALVEDLPLLFDFLAVPDPERPAPRIDPDARRRQLLGVVKRLIRAQGTIEPGISLYEDLHWLDPATEEFLANHVDAVQGTNSLTIVNFRPEYRADWMSKPYYSQIALVPLGAEAIGEMLDDMLGSDPSLDGLPEMLSERTGGNPFFLEEVVQSLAEAGDLEGEPGAYQLVRQVESAGVPASVQVILSARMDRLDGRAKAVLQAASVIGKEFAQPLLSEVAGLEAPELDEALAELVGAGFVYEQEIYPESVYTFKHPLTQEVAYGSQLGERLAADHAAVARAIAKQNPDRLDEMSALLAQHWEAAGEHLEAARFHAQAAVWSGTRDPVECSRHWRAVLTLSQELPESEEIAGLGLAARLFLLQFGWRLGMSHGEAEELFNEAESMARKAGDLNTRALLMGVYAAHLGINVGDAAAMAELGGQAIALAEETGEVQLYLAISGVSYAFFQMGDFRRAVAIVDRSMDLIDHDPDVTAPGTVICPYGSALVFKGGYLAAAGELEEAAVLLERGTQLCRERDDIETTGWAHMWSFWRCYHSGEFAEAPHHAQRAVDFSEQLGAAFSRIWSWSLYGAAQMFQGKWEKGIEALQKSLEMSRELNTTVEGRNWTRLWLAEANLGLGHSERAILLAREATADAHEKSQLYCEAFGHMILGRILLTSNGEGAAEEVERELAVAMDRSRAMGVRTLEPLVHVELAKLAGVRGDDSLRETRLHEAHSEFTKIGARGHAERVAEELAGEAGRTAF